MSVYVVQSDNLSDEDAKLHPLPRLVWENARRSLKPFQNGSKVVFYSANLNCVRHDYLIEKISQEDFNYYYVIAYDTDYSIYEWDISIQRL